jgi:predicted GIY-YIG superfamily endonuclease
MSLFPFPSSLHFPYYSPLLVGTKNASTLRKGWPKATSAAGLTIDGSGRKILTPRLSNIQIHSEDGQEVTALVDMSTVGKTSRELANRIETVTASLHAYQTRVERVSPAHARITVMFSAPQHPSLSPHNDPDNNNGAIDLESIPIYLDQTDQQAAISMTTSLLIGGASESGKSNLVWYLLSQLNDLHIPYRLWVIDPAGGVELSDLETSPLTRQYIDRVSQISSLVTAFRSSMDTRLASMKQRRVRRHFPTVAEPLEIMLVDELLLCKKEFHNGDADSPIGEILASGRKALHIVIGCSQLGQVDVLGRIRDLFPQRICLKTRTQEMTDAVLGTSATSDGAVCHRISTKGEGYVWTDLSGVFEKFNTPLVRETTTIAAGGVTLPSVPAPSTRSLRAKRRRAGRTFLYMLYNIDDPNHPYYRRPCYVGITDNPRRRLREHERGPRAFPEAVWKDMVHSRTRIIAYPTWDDAKAQETALIDYYQPIYNIQERSA